MATAPERRGRGALLLLLLAGAADLALGAAGAPLADARVSGLASGGDRSFASFSHSCAIVDAALQCWGAGRSGQLGDRALPAGRPLPMRVPGLDAVEAVAAGGSHSCAVAQGSVLCWGRNDHRQLGRSGVSLSITPLAVSGLPAPATDVAAGHQHSCAVAAGHLWCWGASSAGELGGSAEESCGAHARRVSCSAEPLRVRGLTGEPSAVALGDAHSCAIVSGSVQCWGANDRGQLGDATTRSRALPAPVVGLEGPPTALAAAGSHTCAVAGGRVQCWGANDVGQLGDGTRVDRSSPVQVGGVPTASAVAAGRAHACAAASGRVHCWGDNGEGQLGSPDPAAVGPLPVPGLRGSVSALAAGADASCAVLEGRRVTCWGADDFGQLGRGRGEGRGPVRVGPWDGSGIRDVDRDGRIVVVCLGDSNTERSPLRPESWCERLGAQLADPVWSTVNRGLGGATAAETSLRPAAWQLEYALANDAPDVVIAAFGTNDLLQEIEPAEIVSAYYRLQRSAASAGVAFFVALTPPAMPASHPLNPSVQALNELLRQAFPAERRIDFWSGFTKRDYDDAIHLGASGQARRASSARTVLRGAADEP